MAAGDKIDGNARYLGTLHSGLYTTDSTSIGAAGSSIYIHATRGWSLLTYQYTLQQRNNSDSSWITVQTGSIGSSSQVHVLRNRDDTHNSYRPRWRWYRSYGNGAATMDVRASGYGEWKKHIKWSNNAVYLGSFPGDNWKGNVGWRITWARRVNLTDD